MIKRGTICWVDLDPVKGSEISKTRPAIVVSND
ncbi:PemK-like protein, partial [Candidatus Magnetoovum chiemensis]